MKPPGARSSTKPKPSPFSPIAEIFPHPPLRSQRAWGSLKRERENFDPDTVEISRQIKGPGRCLKYVPCRLLDFFLPFLFCHAYNEHPIILLPHHPSDIKFAFFLALLARVCNPFLTFASSTNRSVCKTAQFHVEFRLWMETKEEFALLFGLVPAVIAVASAQPCRAFASCTSQRLNHSSHIQNQG